MTIVLAWLVACGSAETPVAIAPDPEPLAETPPIVEPTEPEPPHPTAGLECSRDGWCRIHASGFDLEAIYAASATDVFAGGGETTLLRWNGREWSGGSSPELTGANRTADLQAMHGAESTVFAVGIEGYIARFDGSWSRVGGGGEIDVNGVFAVSSSDAWAVGNMGTALRFDGSAFVRERSGTRRMLNAVWSGGGEVFAVGLEGTIVHRDASGRWRTHACGTTESLTSVWGASPTSVFAVGHSIVLAYDGSAWTAQDANAEGITAIAGHGETLYVVGVGGLVLRKSDGGWTSEASGITEDLRAVSVAPDGTAFAAGRGGVVLMRPVPQGRPEHGG
jgi:hypothetical protein